MRSTKVTDGIIRFTFELPLGIDHVHCYALRTSNGGWTVVDTGLGVDDAAARWETLAGRVPPVISVNLSGRQLAEPDLVDIVQRALESTGLDPTRLLLEITETTIMNAPERVNVLLAELERKGVRAQIEQLLVSQRMIT